MSIHNLIAELMAAGTPPQLVTAVSELITDNALLRLQLTTDNARRQRNAARMRVKRESVRTDVHSAAQDPAYTKKESKEDKKKSRKIYIPIDFEPNETDLAACRDLNWPASKIESELMRFKDDALAHGRRYIDWHAAWRNWVTSPFQSKPNGARFNGHAKPPGLVAAADELLAEIRAPQRGQNGSADHSGQTSFLPIQDRFNGRS